MPTTSASKAKTEFAPPLVAMIQQLEKVTRDRRLRCYALAGPAKHRCKKSYQPWTEHIETVLHTARNSAPPFNMELSTKLAHVLLCDDHRKHEDHVMPLRHALSTVQRTAKALSEKGWHDDADVPRSGENSLQSPHRGSARQARAKSADPDMETPPSLPHTNPTNLVDVRWEFEHDRNMRCIAYDKVAGRCNRAFSKRRLEVARGIIFSGQVDGTSDEDERDEAYNDSDEEERVSPRQLRLLLRLLLCTRHRQWFWVEFYYSQWQRDFASGNTSGGDSEFWDDSGPDTETSHGGLISRSSSDSTTHAEGSSDPDSTLSGPIEDLIQGTFVASVSRTRRGAKASTSSICTPTKSPHTPKRSTEKLTRKARTDPGKATRSSMGCSTQDAQPASGSRRRPQFNPSSLSLRSPSRGQYMSKRKDKQRASRCDPNTPSIHVSSARSSPSLSPSPVPQLRRSPRLAARTSSCRELRNSSFVQPVDEEEAHLIEKLSKLHFGANATILSDGWSLKTGKLLYEEVTRRLSSNSDTGCLYIIESKSHPGFVKVGRAADPARREKQLRSGCKLAGLTLQKFDDVKHHDRVEMLVHRQLVRFKEIIPCIHGKSVQDHHEWFRCDPELARRVVEAWVKWIAKKPYRHNLLRGYWSKRVESLMSGVEEGQRETFEELFQRHERWTQQ